MATIKNQNPNNLEYPDEFEAVFNDAFHKAVNALPTYSETDRRQSWEKVKSKLDRSQRRRLRRKKAQLTGLAAASMILGAVLFSPPLVTKAVSPIYQELRDLGQGVSRIVFGNTDTGSQNTLAPGAKTPAPPDEFSEEEIQEMTRSVHLVAEGEFRTVKMDIQEARKTLAFSLPRITYIPDRFTLKSLEVVIPSGTPDEPNVWGKSASLLYNSEDNTSLRLIFDLLLNGEILTTSSRGITEEIELNNGTIAYLNSGENTEIKMMIGNVYVQAFGDVTREEMLQIVNGLQ